ncbi:MAG: ABC transporter permease [Desulfuromonadaceae bacterium]|nr:ABC transporter permease [Desulfuromonadaceae bacterium]
MAIQPGSVKREEHRLILSGAWVLQHYQQLRAQIALLKRQLPAGDAAPSSTSWTDGYTLELQGITGMDTAGASLVLDFLGLQWLEDDPTVVAELPQERVRLLKTVAATMATPLEPPTSQTSQLRWFLAGIGKRLESLWRQQWQLFGFIGLVLTTLVSTFARPRSWRITSMVAHIQQTGPNAVPIVALLTFLVGAVVGFLGATVLRDFGATIYTVNLVVFSFLREFGVLLAAILLAGRTASAFTAQLGSMKANEEIDAIRALGLDPIEVLVLPRVMAMLVTLPILTFVGMLSGIAGGALVCVTSLDISLFQFVSIVGRDISLTHFVVGMVKAPVFAFVVGVIGCLEGFKVSGSAQSVGEHTTSSVVQSIFMVILLNAIAALFFMQMGW